MPEGKDFIERKAEGFMKAAEKTMDMITGLCKNRGFIFPGSEIYGGLANTWDYGPLGTRLKNNVKDAWRKRFIQERENSFEIDADILMHPRARAVLLRSPFRLQGMQNAPPGRQSY